MTTEDRAAVIELLADSDPWKRLGYQAKDGTAISRRSHRDATVTLWTRTAESPALRSFVRNSTRRLSRTAWSSGLGETQGARETVAHPRRSGGLREGEEPVRLRIGFNDQARHFYKKQGYQEIGPMPNFLIPDSAEILLRKTSGPARGTEKIER